eukprot:UN14509
MIVIYVHTSLYTTIMFFLLLLLVFFSLCSKYHFHCYLLIWGYGFYFQCSGIYFLFSFISLSNNSESFS